MSTAVRKPAPRIARPAAVYRRGQAPKGVSVAELSDSDEDEGVEGIEAEQDEAVEDMPLRTIEGDAGEDESGHEEEDKLRSMKTATGKMNIALRDVNIKEGKVIVAGREESGRTTMEELEVSEEEEVAAAEEDEEESSEDESESEEEAQQPMFRPVFVPKRGRVTVLEREKEAQDTEEALEKKRLEEEERKQQSQDMVAESIRRELAEKEKEKETPDIDDTDGIDPDGEFEAWRLRELSRIKRDKEEQAARDREREEIERRRALPEAQRLQEDLEHAKASRESKPKGSQKFLQKYWHKGAFHQDDEVLTKHDYTAATESTVDVSMLPSVMQVRDFGKRSRTKYTHLVDQDTSRTSGGFGGGSNRPGGSAVTKFGDFTQGCFNCGGPHLKKDCPNIGPLRSGANNANGDRPSRQWGGGYDRDHPLESERRSWKDRDRSPSGRNNNDERDRRPRNEDDRKYDSRDRRRRDAYDDREREDRNIRKYSRRSRSRSRSPRRRDWDRRHSKERVEDGDRRGKRVRTD